MKNKPLASITVLDLSRLFPGAFCTLTLADLGARIIKIEEPGVGDFYREQKGEKLLGEGYFEAFNRAKESLSLNLKTDEGKEIFLKLVKNADVVVESFRPGRLKKLGLHYERLKKINKRVILCSITGYGQTGPYSQRAGHDLNYLSLSGLLSLNKDERGTPQVPGIQIADLVGGGLYGAISILSALSHRERSGKGCWIDLSMTEGVASLAGLYWTGERGSPGHGESSRDLLSGGAASYGVYETQDGKHLGLAALEPKFWQTFKRIAGLRSPVNSGHGPEVFRRSLRRKVARLIAKRPLSYWSKVSNILDSCITPIKELHDVLGDPHFRARRFIFRRKGRRPIEFFKAPYLFDGKRPFAPKRSPRFGEQTRVILRRLGYSALQIRKLKEEGVI